MEVAISDWLPHTRLSLAECVRESRVRKLVQICVSFIIATGISIGQIQIVFIAGLRVFSWSSQV